MSLILKLLFASVIAFSLFFASWYALHDDLIFDADIGRDFHLLRELDEKKPVIYLLIQPPPRDNPYMKEGFWIKYQIRIDSPPSAVIELPNKYKIMKMKLSQKEIDIPYDPAIDLGLHFR